MGWRRPRAASPAVSLTASFRTSSFSFFGQFLFAESSRSATRGCEESFSISENARSRQCPPVTTSNTVAGVGVGSAAARSCFGFHRPWWRPDSTRKSHEVIRGAAVRVGRAGRPRWRSTSGCCGGRTLLTGSMGPDAAGGARTEKYSPARGQVLRRAPAAGRAGTPRHASAAGFSRPGVRNRA